MFKGNNTFGIIRNIAIIFVLLFLTFSPFSFSTFATNDLLNQAFDEAKRYDYIVNPGNDKDAVGGQIFNPTADVTIFGPNQGVELKEPYLVRITKLILRVMIAISVSIIIFGGIRYILAFGDAAKQKKATNIIPYALGGIILGLSSLAIIQLALSITKSSIEF